MKTNSKPMVRDFPRAWVAVPCWVLGFFFFCSTGWTTVHNNTGSKLPPGHPLLLKKISSLQIPFIENQGQLQDTSVLYYADTFAGNVAVTAQGEIEYTVFNRTQHEKTGNKPFRKADRKRDPVSLFSFREKLVNGDLGTINGQGASPTTVNYFKGKQQDWRKDIPTWQEVGLGAVYEGVHLHLRAHRNNVEKIFTVYPEGSVGDIQLAVEGAQGLTLDSDGNLVIATGTTPVSMTKPVAFQMKEQKKQFIQVAYHISGDAKTYGFTVGDYDTSLPLIIDPSLSYFTYAGTPETDRGLGIAVDSSDNVWLTGTRYYVKPPYTIPYTDIVISKFNPSVTDLLFTIYYGGGYEDYPGGIVADGSGSIYISGGTESNNFPTTDGTTCDGSSAAKAFAVKLSAADGAVDYSKCYGDWGAPTNWDDGVTTNGGDITVDSLGNAYLTGYTYAPDFPETGPYYKLDTVDFQTPFVVKVDPNGDLIYATIFGGTGIATGTGIAVDGSGNVFVTGYTGNDDFPLVNAIKSTKFGGQIGFVTKINATGDSFGFSTYLGGDTEAFCSAIDVDQFGNVYITGYTDGPNFPLSANPYQDYAAGTFNDAFITKLNNTGAIEYSTFLGGNMADIGYGITVNSDGSVYVAGNTLSTDFPVVDQYQGPPAQQQDAFLARLSPGGDALLFSTYLGGSAADFAAGLAVSPAGTVYVTGSTTSTDVVPPNTFDGYQSVAAGGRDAFIAVFEESSTPGDSDGDGDLDVTDCQPNNQFVYTGAPESCNGVDDDCDGVADGSEGLTQSCGTDVGECTIGTQSCDDNGNWGTCSGIEPVPETCNGLDDNCNGVPDGSEGLTQPCGTDEGECTSGIETCTDSGAWVGCTATGPFTEICNGFDDNCDGVVDKDMTLQDPDLTRPTTCGTTGACFAEGFETCTAGVWGDDTCTPGISSDEMCNGIDDDCDGLTDNIPEADIPAFSDPDGVCGAAKQTCLGEAGWQDVYANVTNYESPETTCGDNLDNDCDGVIDEGCSATYNLNIKPYSSWEPGDGNSIIIEAEVINSDHNPPAPVDNGAVTYTFSLAALDPAETAVHPHNPSRWPGKYTNDSSTDASDDFSWQTGDLTDGNSTLTLTSLDYGGSVKITVSATVNNNPVSSKTFWVPADSDNDRLPDNYEEKYGNYQINGNLSPEDNNELSIGATDPTINTGDLLTAFQEYRGFLWGPELLQIEPGDPVVGGNPYQTTAFVPSSDPVVHFRTSPDRKDLFIKFEDYDYITYSYDQNASAFTADVEYDALYPDNSPFDGAFALGGAFASVALDVHPYCMNLPGTPPGEQNLRVIRVKNELVEAENNNIGYHITKSSTTERLWSPQKKGKYFGKGDLGNPYPDESVAVTYQKTLDAYFDDRPYEDKETWIVSSETWGGPDQLLNGLDKVEDENDNGVEDTKEDGRLTKPDSPNGEFEGDLFAGYSVYDQQLSPFDIDNDGMVENEIRDGQDPTAPETGLTTGGEADYHEYTRSQCIKHTITHEITHGLTVPTHLSDPNCLMAGTSRDWERDASFCQSTSTETGTVDLLNIDHD